jgi:hypothetical protein
MVTGFLNLPPWPLASSRFCLAIHSEPHRCQHHIFAVGAVPRPTAAARLHGGTDACARIYKRDAGRPDPCRDIPSTILSAIITKPIADAQCEFHGHA